MNAVKVNEAHQIEIPILRPGDYYEPEALGENDVLLRRVPGPRRKLSYADALAAVESSALRFTSSWDDLKRETR